MRIVHVNTEQAWGGGEAQTEYLVTGLRARGIDNILIAQPDGQIARRLRNEGIAVVGLRMRGECDFVAALRLSRLLRELDPDVLHLHTSHAHTLGLLAGRLAGTKSIVVTRRMDHEIRGLLSAFKYRHVDRVVAISRVIRDILLRGGVPEERIRVIHSVVVCPEPYPQDDLRRALGIGGGAPVIGTIATLAERKGHRYLIEAVSRLKEHRPELRVLVVGEGPQEAELRELASRLRLGDTIIFAGFRRDIPQVLNTLDIFVLASQREGLGVALLEAACCGLPIIGSNVGGIPEIVRDGTTGLLVPPADPVRLAEKLAYLLDHPERARKLGDNAKTFVKGNFSLESMVGGYVELYKGLLTNSA
jgi:glycosyltransferase involved in cell wall biosynthesis